MDELKVKTIIKTILLAITLTLGIGAFSGCRTAHGFGEDIEDAGHKIQKGTD